MPTSSPDDSVAVLLKPIRSVFSLVCLGGNEYMQNTTKIADLIEDNLKEVGVARLEAVRFHILPGGSGQRNSVAYGYTKDFDISTESLLQGTTSRSTADSIKLITFQVNLPDDLSTDIKPESATKTTPYIGYQIHPQSTCVIEVLWWNLGQQTFRKTLTYGKKA